MVFSSVIFLFRFLPVFFTIYYLAPGRLKNCVLLAGSLFFYAWGEPACVSLLLFSTLSDYFHGRSIARAKQAGRSATAKVLLISSLGINLFLLGFFKYAGLIADSINRIAGTGLSAPVTALPAGISFYTFQIMSYCIDVYRGKVPPQKDFILFGTYVSMFPQLVAGPIVRYETVADGLRARRVTIDDFHYGIRRFITGLSKKVLLANQAGALWETISSFDTGRLTVLSAWSGILFFAFQIYFDFSGYSDMAIGLGRMLGFSFPENFRYPYMADSVTDFWRRWHITLGSWFKEYVYIPLGGGRKGAARRTLNLMIVWMLTGLWHGASWNFLLWGLWFAVFLAVEKEWEKRKKKRWGTSAIPGASGVRQGLRRLYTMLVVLAGWVLFALPDAGTAAAWFQAMAGVKGAGLLDSDILYLLSGNLTFLALLCLGCTPVPARAGRMLFRHVRRMEAAESVPSQFAEAVLYTGMFLLSLAFLISENYNPFLYFRF